MQLQLHFNLSLEGRRTLSCCRMHCRLLRLRLLLLLAALSIWLHVFASSFSVVMQQQASFVVAMLRSVFVAQATHASCLASAEELAIAATVPLCLVWWHVCPWQCQSIYRGGSNGAEKDRQSDPMCRAAPAAS